MRDDHEGVSPRGYDWAGGDGWNVPWERIDLLQAQIDLVRHRLVILASWEKEREVLREARAGQNEMSLTDMLGE